MAAHLGFRLQPCRYMYDCSVSVLVFSHKIATVLGISLLLLQLRVMVLGSLQV